MAFQSRIRERWGFPFLLRFSERLYKRMLNPIPSDIEALLKTLTFKDVLANVEISNRTVLLYTEEKPWCIWTLGFGAVDAAPNDIIVDLGWNTETDYVGATITKLAANPFEIYKEDLLLGTLAEVNVLDTPVACTLATVLRPAAA